MNVFGQDKNIYNDGVIYKGDYVILELLYIEGCVDNKQPFAIVRNVLRMDDFHKITKNMKHQKE